MTESVPTSQGEREMRLRYPGTCRACGTALPAGTRARWNPASRTVRCLGCPQSTTYAGPPDAIPASPGEHRDPDVDWGRAGASAQRQFDRQEGRRRARLRSRWFGVLLLSAFGAVAGAVLATGLHTNRALYVALGVALPVLRVLATPQHIAAWRTGARGERAVGATLDRLRDCGVYALHDRRVPGRRTNIDHIAVCPAGIFVIDTKNVSGKVTATCTGVRIAGRRRDQMVHGVHHQLTVVRQALCDEGLPSATFRGVLCFTRADLPWAAAAPDGIALLGPRGLQRALLRPGPLTPQQVHRLATSLARRLPAA